MLLKRMISTLLCVLLLLGVCAVPTTAETDLHDAFMKTAFMVSRYEAFFEQGETPLSFITQYLEHICPEMRQYEIVREPYFNIVNLFNAVPVEEYETLVGRYFEMNDRIRAELQTYYRADVDMYYLPCTVIDAVHNFSWYDYVGYKALGGDIYELYARRMSNQKVYTDVSGLTEGVDYVRVVEHRRRFHPTLQQVFYKAEVFNRAITHTISIKVRMNNGVPQLVSTAVCDAERFTESGVVASPGSGIADTIVNTLLPSGVSCSGQEALPNGACLVGSVLTQGDIYNRAVGALAGKVNRFAVYDLTAVDDVGGVLSCNSTLRFAFSDYGAGGYVYRLDDNGKLIPVGNASSADIRAFGVYVVTDKALPTTAATALSTTVATTVTAPTTVTGTAADTTEPVVTTTVPTAQPTTVTTAVPSAPVEQGDATVGIPVGAAVAAVVIVAVVVLVLLKKKR